VKWARDAPVSKDVIVDDSTDSKDQERERRSEGSKRGSGDEARPPRSSGVRIETA